MSAGRALLAVLLILASAGAALAQANGYSGSIMLGTMAAKQHAEARSGRGIRQWRLALEAWQTPRKLLRETPSE